MRKTHKGLGVLIVILLTIYIFLNIILENQVYAVRSAENDFSNLINYPSIYTLVQEQKTAHPNWNFVMLYTGLNWSDVIYNEALATHDRSLVQTSVMTGNRSDWICSTCGDNQYDNGSWRHASEKTVSYYMDVRNWLNEKYIFAFESLQYNGNLQTIDGVRAILSGTFMGGKSSISYIDTSGQTQTIYKSYEQIIMEAAQEYGVSPYLLASRIKQEQGNGSSGLISGRYTYTDGTEYVGYYNYFNVKATGNGNAEIIKKGLDYAKEKGWTTPELSIKGGAEFLAKSYIQGHQDTQYLQKYEIDPEDVALYKYQYMQNVSAPYSEGQFIRQGYIDMGLLGSGFTFVIPIFENMPDVASPKPGRNLQFVTETVQITTQSQSLPIRSGPSTNYASEFDAPRGTVLTRIEKATEVSSDGRYWDTVMYNSGSEIIIGYSNREYLGEIATVNTMNEIRATSTMCNLRNAPGTSDSKVIKVLSQGVVLTLTDKIGFPVDGHIWYRVTLSDGTQGYVSEAYLTTAQIEKYKIEGDTVKVTPDTAITDIPNAVIPEGRLYTGEKITINESEYTVVMLGDVNGDGEVDVIDLAILKRHLVGTNILENYYYKAGLLQQNTSEIDVIALALLKRFLIGTAGFIL